MTGWAPKRFWTTATLGEDPAGHTVLLDGRTLRTPAKALFAVPSAELACAIAAEWNAQGDTLRPDTMPYTRLANTAIDTVAVHFDTVVDTVSDYGSSDLLCYRAASPDALVSLQASAWDPLVDWAADALGARLRVTSGVIPVDQDANALKRLAATVRALEPFSLTALHELVTLSGSLVLGLAVTSGKMNPDDAWAVSRIDEEWQISLWGRDAEADLIAEAKKNDFLRAYRFLSLARGHA